jgi:hypothetical protein
MKRFLVLVLGVFLGAVVGAMANMGLIHLGSSLLPPPPGVDVNDAASINARLHEYSVAQLLVPFVAHAVGTLVGAFVAAKANARHGRALPAACAIGGLFLVGGIAAVQMLPAAPLWFDVLDLGVAYLPMAWLGWRLAGGQSA